MILYALLDKISGSMHNFQKFIGDSAACRYYMRQIYSKVEDFEILALGELSDPIVESDGQDGDYVKIPEQFSVFSESRSVSWSAYRLPDSEAEALSPLKLSKEEFLREMERKYDIVNSQK